ncbi:hypothetical protein Y1Q_0005305 [Alligator mississippiensis]|uniref:SCAN box domain-containing protein n=1 Tax=Alligator mississippiensis TaxID=8496 RepID=A0A151MTC3_ALLMI|nr:hypothetical protein Y1Q_0005305 [Alligator mississippiensis]
MTKDDDPEAYIEAFEQTAIQTGLDRSQWGHQLGVLVIDEAQAAYRALSREEAQDYEAVKAAILYWLEISPKTYRQAFRACKLRENGKIRTSSESQTTTMARRTRAKGMHDALPRHHKAT